MLLLKNNPHHHPRLRAPLGCHSQGWSRQVPASQVRAAGKSSAQPSATHPAPESHCHTGDTLLHQPGTGGVASSPLLLRSIY